ncbi:MULTISPECIES: cellulose synthase family protein [Pseudanabaena]|uniref:Glucomannan 4-beta-mannosyltransferase n=2 Tax=Pseudanabaena TaxID=1152 RepID=L8N554_9CYAN|nr:MULTISPECIES: cellulose synthase family protein [Pseudanabaena]ELS34766.1 Glucomannan 4-beta-mannosyltransferase [Pseudanabaena biceps PCC 7429]MDG3493003.1 glycosyltransferase family 2 protein [Pseudanabaena catenata USMAC16]
MWLLLYGLNAYWLTAVHKPKLSLRKQLVFPQLNPAREYQTAQAATAPSTSAGAIAVNKFDNFDQFRLDKPLNNSFASYVLAVDPPEHHAIALEELPIVTIQLPIFNERYVSRRLVDAVCKLDYPRDRMQIQVLDDSIDDTQEILSETVQEYQNQGFWIEYVHRVNRTGFKAGALQDAMPLVQGNYIAIFDADFIPSANWLKDTIRHYVENPDAKVAVVQTRWGHINSEYSLLTKLQSTGIDGHFAIEQQARCNNGYFLNFNGTAGIWNRQAIIDAGGWHADTLAEDMDLSYRAQLKGWKVVYDNNIVAPAELPVAMLAFKLQQFRWAKGSIQCAKKLMFAIWEANLSFPVKFQATMHLSGYSAHPLMLLLVLLSIPLMLITPDSATALRVSFEGIWSVFMLPATFGPPFLYFHAQRDLYPKLWYRRLGRIFLLAVLGTGISWSNSRAVFAGLSNTGANFRRTPKFDIKHKSDRWENKAYKIPLDATAAIEIGLCIYSAIASVLAFHKGLYITLPFMVLYALSYGYVGGLTLWQSWQQSRN